MLKGSEQTGQIPRLFLAFAQNTCHFVRFVGKMISYDFKDLDFMALSIIFHLYQDDH